MQEGDLAHRAKNPSTYGLLSSTQRLYNKDLTCDSKSLHRGWILYLQPRARPPPDVREHREVSSDPSLEDAGNGIRRDRHNSYFQVCSHETLVLTYKCSFSHSALQAARTAVEVSKITTPKNRAEGQRTRAFVLRAPAQPRRETFGLLVAQPWKMCSGPTPYCEKT